MSECRIDQDNGTKRWYKNGALHREDGPAMEYPDGSKVWIVNGNFHRDDGPAVEYSNGDKTWWVNGLRHREDGPAIEYKDGEKCVWWYRGTYIGDQDDFLVKIKFAVLNFFRNINILRK